MDLPTWTRTILIHRDHLNAEILNEVEQIAAPPLIGGNDDIGWATFVRSFCLAVLLMDARMLERDRTRTEYESGQEARRLRYLAADLAKVASARWWREKGWLYRGDHPDVVKSFEGAKRSKYLHLVEGRYVLSQELGLVRAAG